MKAAACVTLLLWMGAAPLAARAQGAARVLSWEECVALALRGNPELASSRSARDASRASYRGSFNGFLPRLSVSNSYNDGKDADASARWQAQGTASLSLLDAAKAAGIRAASADLAQSEASLRQASASARFDLRQAFSQLLFSQKEVEVFRAVADIRRRDSALVTLRYDSGRESKGNMMRAKAQMLQAEASLAQAARDRGTAEKSLARRLGMDDFRSLSASGTLDTEPPSGPPEHAGGLLARRPDLAAQEAAVKSAQAGLGQAESALWPNLSANYTRSFSDSREFPNARPRWTFGGLLSFPLFGGGPTDAYFAVSAAKRRLEKARQDLRAVYGQARVDLESAWSDFASAADQVRVQLALLEAARQRNDEADVRYASGLLSFDNWELIVSDRVGSERQAIQAQLNAAVAEAAWHKALGRPLGE